MHVVSLSTEVNQQFLLLDHPNILQYMSEKSSNPQYTNRQFDGHPQDILKSKLTDDTEYKSILFQLNPDFIIQLVVSHVQWRIMGCGDLGSYSSCQVQENGVNKPPTRIFYL